MLSIWVRGVGFAKKRLIDIFAMEFPNVPNGTWMEDRLGSMVIYSVLLPLRIPTPTAGTYSQALERAKSELRYMLVVLHSSEHDDTEAFCRQTLTAERFLTFLTDKNILVWAGDVREPEAFRVSNVLLATRYPFLGVVAPQGSRMVVASRIEGPKTAEEVETAINRVIERMDPSLAAIRAERREREQARILREQQDEAYQASLRADQEKERRAREERERLQKEKEDAERVQREKLERRETKKQRKVRLRETLPPEPEASETDLAKLSIRFPNGERRVRRFRATDKIQLLYDYVESSDLSPLDLEAEFVVVNTYPRKMYTDLSITIQEAGLMPSASIIVEEKIPDEEE
ncbi:hypothetical protein HK104_010951 [Borealophlyctis nickersoniae]|nr:hypothetical protein HK104_010951 [Borealophlyctis nickersoniae]